MSNRRSRLRSELGDSARMTDMLTNLATLIAQSPSHVSVQMGGFRANGANLTTFAITGSGSTGNITFKRSPAVAVKASLNVQDLLFTADTAGTGGNSITIHYTTGGTAGSEVVTVVSNAITVQIESGVSTATQVKTAIDASIPAAALVDVTISGTGSHAQTAPVAATNLAEGQAATSLETYDKADIIMIRRLRNRKWLIEIDAAANPA